MLKGDNHVKKGDNHACGKIFTSMGRQPCYIDLEMSSSLTSLKIPLSRSVEYEIC